MSYIPKDILITDEQIIAEMAAVWKTWLDEAGPTTFPYWIESRSSYPMTLLFESAYWINERRRVSIKVAKTDMMVLMERLEALEKLLIDKSGDHK